MLSKTLILIAFAGMNFQGYAWAENPSEPIKIGIMASLTGIEANEGRSVLKAFDLGLKQINAEGGVNGAKIVGIAADTKSDPAGALAAYDKLIFEDKVAAIIGPSKSAQIIAMIPKMQKAAIPTVIGGTATRLTAEGRWFFRIRPDDSIASEAMVAYVKRQTKFTKLGIIHDLGAFGSGGANLIEKNAKTYGLKVVKRIGFTIGESDFSNQLKAIKSAGAQVLIVYSSRLEDSAQIEKDFAKLGRPFLYIGSASSQSKLALDIAKNAADGILAVVYFVFGQTEINRKYLNAYRKEYGEKPDPATSYSFDGIQILVNAIRAAGGREPEKIRREILKLHNFEGIQGRYNFSPNGDGLHAATIVKVENGQTTVVETFDVNGR